jgi:AAA domain
MKARDANDILRENGPDALRAVFDRAEKFNGRHLPRSNKNEDKSQESPLRIVRTLPEFLKEFISPDYLIDGLLQRHFCYSLTGATSAGKTAIALLMASLVACRALGQKFGPHAVEHGRVIYIAAENPTDVRMRLIGMVVKLGLDIDPNDFLVIEQIIGLDEDLARITREIEQFGNCDLVVVDTSPSLFPGDNENDNVQSRDHGKRLRRLCDLPGRPAVVALCHPTKRVSGPDDLLPRGGGAFLAEMDGNFSLWAHDEKLADLHWCGKFRGPEFAKITFRLTTVITPELVDTKGRVLPTVLAQVVTEAEARANELNAVDQEDRLLSVMMKRPGATLEKWAQDCSWFVAGDLAKPNKSRAQRVMKRLERSKLVEKDGRDFVPTKAGAKAASKVNGSNPQP